jgi:hypothetical protein
MNRQEYLNTFLGGQDAHASERLKVALTQALDIRKFEIDLYWKRATYFWTFISVIFAGYGYVIMQPDNAANKGELTYLLSIMGFLFSLAWYFVNRGSKAWQSNWEKHVDILETNVTGPLYKTVFGRYDFWSFKGFLNPVGSYFFSVSKINQLLAFYVTFAWGFLIVQTVSKEMCWDFFSWYKNLEAWILILLPVSGAFLLYFSGQTSFKRDADVWFRIRGMKDITSQYQYEDDALNNAHTYL